MTDLGPHPYRYSLLERVGFYLFVAIVMGLGVAVAYEVTKIIG